jgi:hypothetical protein
MTPSIAAITPVGSKDGLVATVSFTDGTKVDICKSPKGTRYVKVKGKLGDVAADKMKLIDAKFPSYL